MNVTVDFNKTKGAVKPLNSACIAPYSANGGDKYQGLLNKIFTEANIPYCRLHDCQGAYGGTYYVDITNVFPDFGADENDPDSYDFHYTDEYIGEIAKTGCEAYYRLGETIEWGSKKYSTVVPPDFSKWARICEHIVRHYNEGWADGFHYDLTYWEIWNEPENQPMWTGTQAEYFELYRVTSNLLKSEFPEIRVGGYASCGFYAAFDENADDFYRSFLMWFDDFLAYVKAPQTASPLDFFSWHIYSSDPEQVLAHARYCREKLDAAGFADTEAILDEWNWAGNNMFEEMRNMTGAAFTADVMCRLQQTDVADVACYYDAQPDQAYGGLFLRHTDTPSRTYYAVKAFGMLRSLGNEANMRADTDLAAAAATDGSRRIAVISNYEKSSRPVLLSFPGASNIKLYLLDNSHDLSPIAEVSGDSIAAVIDKNTVLLAAAEDLNETN